MHDLNRSLQVDSSQSCRDIEVSEGIAQSEKNEVTILETSTMFVCFYLWSFSDVFSSEVILDVTRYLTKWPVGKNRGFWKLKT